VPVRRGASAGCLAVLVVGAIACGGGNGADDPADVLPDLLPDVPPDVPAPVIPETLGGARPAALYVPEDYDPAVEGAETTTRGWSGCLQGTRVDHWKMVGSGHSPPFTDAFREAVLDHLLSLDRPAP